MLDRREFFFRLSGGLAGCLLGGHRPAASENTLSPSRLVDVFSGTQLAAALANARPGDHIVLANGTYTNGTDFTTSVAGTAAAPIVIRAQNKLLARLTRRINFGHAYYYLWGIDIDGVGLGIAAGAANLVVRRCRVRNFNSYQGIWCRVSAPDVRFEYCDLSLPNSRGIALDLGAGGTRLTVSRCWFHDWGPSGTTNQTFEPIQLGFGRADVDRDGSCRIEYCLFENINQGNGENECISIKSANNTVYGCHLKDARSIMCRHGRRARIEACRIENVAGNALGGIEIMSTDHKVLGTAVSGPGTIVRIYAGTVDGDAPTSSWTDADYPSAKRARLVGVTSSNGFRVGHRYNSSMTVPATDTRLENCTGTVTLLNATNTVQTGTASETHDPPVTLARTDVGPDAP